MKSSAHFKTRLNLCSSWAVLGCNWYSRYNHPQPTEVEALFPLEEQWKGSSNGTNTFLNGRKLHNQLLTSYHTNLQANLTCSPMFSAML